MEQIKKNQYVISKPERIGLKMKTLELDSGLKICTDFQKQAAEALSNLKSETSSYEKKQTDAAWTKGVVTVVAAAGAAVVTGGALAGLACTAMIGGVVGSYSYYTLVSEYENIVTETSKLHSALKLLQGEQNKKNRNVEAKKKQIDFLTE